MKEIEYIQVGDYQLPNLKVEEMHLNRFGRAKLDYLKKHDYLLSVSYTHLTLPTKA